MPRKPRIHVPGGFYHVILRGNARQNIFFSARDRQFWESLLETALARHDHRLHAYCWMTNHVHMAVQGGTEPLAKFMSFLASNYARTCNRQRLRSGHLFERRYQAILVQQNNYLLELVRYIHLNPVRANMVETPSDYQWSSHNAYLGINCPNWLTVTTVLNMFATRIGEARRRYASFMHDKPPCSMLDLLRRGNESNDQVLGDDHWLEIIERKLDNQRIGRHTKTSLDDLIRQACDTHSTTEYELAGPSRKRALARIRAQIALDATEQGIASISEVARRLGRTQPTLSRATQKLRSKQK